MLLWQDSLHFPEFSLLPSEIYPSQVGMQVVTQATRNVISITNGTFRPVHATPTGFGSEQVTIGLRLEIRKLTSSAPVDNTSIFEIRDAGGVTKIRAKLRTNQEGYSFQFSTSDSTILLLQSPQFAYGDSIYFEFQIAFSASQGSITVRADGTIAAKSENLTTDLNPVQSWRFIQFLFGANPLQFLLSDLYILDGSGSNRAFKTFLGPVSGSRTVPAQVPVQSMDWAYLPVVPGKYRIFWMLGQSNAHGLGFLAEPHRPWRSPNNKVLIWSTRTAPTPSWDPLLAGVNTWGHMYGPGIGVVPWFGAEMQFAERIALLCDKAPTALPTTNVRILKTVFDASNIDNWIPEGPTNFALEACNMFDTAVAALGGISNIEDITISWYRGESDLLAGNMPYLYASKLLTTLQYLAFRATPAPVRFFLTRLHPKSDFGFGTTDYHAEVRKHNVALEIVASQLPNTEIILNESARLRQGDGLHLTGMSQDHLGDAYFEAWFKHQNPALFLQGVEPKPVPSAHRWVGSESLGSIGMTPESVLSAASINSPVLGGSVRQHLASTGSGLLETLIGDRKLQSAVVPSLPQWSLLSSHFAGYMRPEEFLELMTMKFVP